MNIVAILVGAAVILAVFSVIIGAMAQIEGWWVALGIWAFAVVGTAIITGAAFLIAWGIAA